mgnify:CR=1 FL=1
MPRILIAASGTGGHIFPALAVAEAFPMPWEVIWLGVADRLETKLLPEKYFLKTISGGGLQGSFYRKMLSFLKLFLSTFDVVSLIRKKRINVVFSTGGYIAAPAILAAVLCNIPIILHESNAEPGRVVKLMARFCNIVAIGFMEASNRLIGCKTLFTGTPVRSSFFSLKKLPGWVPFGDGPLIVVMGGSQGAVGLNKMVRKIIPRLLNVGCRIVHLTGENDPEYKKTSHANLVERKFSNEIPALLKNADLVISRSGASALSELAVCEIPAILVPYPQAKDNHQEINALNFAKAGAAVIVSQNQSNNNALWNSISELLALHLGKPDRKTTLLINMRLAMKKMAVFDSVQKLIDAINQLI